MIWSFVAAALLAACSSSNNAGPPDSGQPDAGDDGGMDVAPPADAEGDATDAAGDATSDVAADGAALPACSSLTNPLYIMGGDTQVPILKTLGKALRQDANPVTLVWQATGSCTIIDAVYNGTPLKQNLSYIPDDPSWDASSGTVPTCTPDAGGAPVQVGIPIVFPEACTSQAAPAGVKAFKGPIQSFVFVVPTANTAQAISAEEAYMVFGFGATGGVMPWIDPMFFFVRPATKGTQVSLGAVINVPAAKWKGQKIDQSTSVASMVAASTAPDKTIGILGAEIYDSATNRAAMRALSFEAFGQTGGYFPDATVTTFDKRNVRDGHYAAWSHVFYMTAIDSSGAVMNANAGRLIDILTGAPNAAAPAGVDPLALVASKGLVPPCAMTVQRSAEGGPLYRSQPASPCGCFYESVVGTAPSTCTACSASAPCAGTGQQCIHGFCEGADGRTSLADCASAPANDGQIPNFACAGRTVAPQRPLPQKVMDNGGALPMLP
jgi:hypothetical protein